MRAQKLQCDPQPALRDPGLHLGAHARFRMPHTAVCGDGLGTLAMFPQGDWSMGGGLPSTPATAKQGRIQSPAPLKGTELQRPASLQQLVRAAQPPAPPGPGHLPDPICWPLGQLGPHPTPTAGTANRA